jgi:hypothetical protein
MALVRVQPSKADPGWGMPGSGRAAEPTGQSDKAMGWIAAGIGADNSIADLNRKAALWTAASVLLSAASAFVSALATHSN